MFLSILLSSIALTTFLLSPLNRIELLYYWLSGWRSVKRTRFSPLRPGFDTRRRHVRWSYDHQVRQVGFLRALRFPPTRRPSKRKHRCKRA